MLQDDHSHTFHHQIETDGVSCSILLILKDKVGQRFKAPKAEKEKEEYIDERLKLIDKYVVGVDPNMNDLIFEVNSDGKDQKKFRYTQDKRRKETNHRREIQCLMVEV
jgi:hypothetical protein